MIICHCFNVSDREIRLAIALGATDLESLADECGAGLGCGNCQEALAEMMAEMIRKQDAQTSEQSQDVEVNNFSPSNILFKERQ